MDTIKVLDQLEMLVEDSKKFMGFVRLDEDEFFMLTSKLRASLPEDVRKASKLAENTDRILEAAQGEAENIVGAARAEAAKMLEGAKGEAEHLVETARADGYRTVEEAKGMSQSLTDQSEITRIARAQADGILAQAESEARDIRSGAEGEAQEIRGGADAYARDVLMALEKQIQDALGQLENKMTVTLSTIQRGRRSLERDSAVGAENNGIRNGHSGEVAGIGNGGRG